MNDQVEVYAVGRYDGSIDVISLLTLDEAHSLLNSYAEVDPSVKEGAYYIAGPLDR
jgi:hypothetical protein